MHRTHTVRAFSGSAVLLALSVSLLGAGACSSEDPPVKQCGGVERDGQCFKKCDLSKCAEANYCFTTDERPEGFCGLPCTDSSECGWGFTCAPGSATLPDFSTRDAYCMGLGLAGNGAPGTTCTADAQCDTGHGLNCLQGACTWKCSGLGLCPGGYECAGIPDATQDGPQGHCVAKGEETGPGQYGTDCPSGKSDVCDQAGGFQCIGVVGTGYCSKKGGCEQDQDCPSGYWCSTMRVAKDTSGNIDFAQRPRVCSKRQFCAPCDTDVDCSFQTGAVCVPDKNNEKFCTHRCEASSNSCRIGSACTDVGDGLLACVPDVGVCHEAEPKGCSPCRNDADCGDNAICASGMIGYKQGVNWCMTPCGPADEFGKNTCPLAPNGLEMLCLDENELSIGGPFVEGDPTVPNYIYKHCYAPFTVDNSEMFGGEDPPRNVCGNYIREGDEECDDGNSTATDGCDKCKVTAACTFAITEPNGDVWDDPPLEPVLAPAPSHITTGDPRMKYVVQTTKCPTFMVTGALETAGDVDTIAFRLDSGADAWLNTYAGPIGTCNADLMTEVRVWGNAEATTALNLLDKTVGCKDLSSEIMDLANGKLCPSNNLACGSCSKPGICGSCDDDGGYGNCNRMLLSTNTSYAGYKVDFEGKYKLVRIYAREPSHTVGAYTVVISKFKAQSTGNEGATGPTLSCH
jgi:cysteine-rich repeat protein